MAPEEIKALRKELRCTPRELAAVLGVDANTVLAWERDELFPTRRYIRAMDELREQGMGAVPRMRGRAGSATDPFKLLNDPQMWQLMRKLLKHGELRKQVLQLADGYDDPAA